MWCCLMLLMVGAVVVLGVELEKVEVEKVEVEKVEVKKVEVDTRGEPPACCR